MTFTLRSLADADHFQASEILYQSWQEVFAQWIPSSIGERMTRPTCESIVSKILREQGERISYMGCYEDGELLGTLVWGPSREDGAFEAELISMLVDRRAF